MTEPPSRPKNQGGGFPSLIPSIILSNDMSDALKSDIFSDSSLGTFSNGFQSDIIYLST